MQIKELIAAITEPKPSIRYVYLVSGYSVLVCTLYLWGYWSTFNINILQYADVSSILKLAAFPLIVGLSGLMLGSVFGHLIFSNEPSDEGILAAQQSKFGQFVREYYDVISLVWVFVTILFFYLAQNQNGISCRCCLRCPLE